MKKYDGTRRCCKCGWKHTEDRWRKAGVFVGPAPEWISRRCERCGYIWDELPLDAAEG